MGNSKCRIRSLVLEMKRKNHVVSNTFFEECNRFLTTVDNMAYMQYIHSFTENTEKKDVARKKSAYYLVETNKCRIFSEFVVSSKQELCKENLCFYITTLLQLRT